MTERTSTDRLAEYVHVFRGFGFSAAAVAARHDVDEAALPDALADALPGTDPAALYDSLHAALAASKRGVEVPRDHEPADAVDAIGDALEPYGCSFAAEATGEDTFDLTLTDASGESRTTTFTYPDSEFGTANAPALAHAVETELLAGIPMTFALLTERDDAWRLVFVRERRLNDLQSRLGLRLQVFDSPLLCVDQPKTFAEGEPSTYRAATDGGGMTFDAEPPGDDALAGIDAEPADPATVVPETAALAAEDGDVSDEDVDAVVAALEKSGPRRVVGEESVDEVLATIHERPVVEGSSDDGTTGGDAGAADAVAAAFDDLSAVSLSPSPTDDVGGGPERVVGEGVPDVVASVDGEDADGAAGLDAAFDRMETETALDDAHEEQDPIGASPGHDLIGGGPVRVVGEGVDDLLASVTGEEADAAGATGDAPDAAGEAAEAAVVPADTEADGTIEWSDDADDGDGDDAWALGEAENAGVADEAGTDDAADGDDAWALGEAEDAGVADEADEAGTDDAADGDDDANELHESAVEEPEVDEPAVAVEPDETDASVEADEPHETGGEAASSLAGREPTRAVVSSAERAVVSTDSLPDPGDGGGEPERTDATEEPADAEPDGDAGPDPDADAGGEPATDAVGPVQPPDPESGVDMPDENAGDVDRPGGPAETPPVADLDLTPEAGPAADDAAGDDPEGSASPNLAAAESVIEPERADADATEAEAASADGPLANAAVFDAPVDDNDDEEAPTADRVGDTNHSTDGTGNASAEEAGTESEDGGVVTRLRRVLWPFGD